MSGGFGSSGKIEIRGPQRPSGRNRDRPSGLSNHESACWLENCRAVTNGAGVAQKTPARTSVLRSRVVVIGGRRNAIPRGIGLVEDEKLVHGLIQDRTRTEGPGFKEPRSGEGDRQGKPEPQRVILRGIRGKGSQENRIRRSLHMAALFKDASGHAVVYHAWGINGTE